MLKKVIKDVSFVTSLFLLLVYLFFYPIINECQLFGYGDVYSTDNLLSLVTIVFSNDLSNSVSFNLVMAGRSSAHCEKPRQRKSSF